MLAKARLLGGGEGGGGSGGGGGVGGGGSGGDGGALWRQVGGDAKVTRWLQRRGWGRARQTLLATSSIVLLTLVQFASCNVAINTCSPRHQTLVVARLE